jgi:hypothetical protein
MILSAGPMDILEVLLSMRALNATRTNANPETSCKPSEDEDCYKMVPFRRLLLLVAVKIFFPLHP